jgi:glycosyltransferase involved in cell wall biosynthesis
MTFEPDLKSLASSEEVETIRRRLSGEGIRWSSLRYHKRPTLPATLYDIMAGAWHAARYVRRHDINVLHARSHVPLVMALLARRLTGCRLVFDIRGLMAEEYADAGVWKENSLPFRLVKWVERLGVRRADQIVVLTERMKAWLTAQGMASAEEIEVIPCCVDFGRFDVTSETTASESSGRFEIVYAGSVTGLYLLEEMGRFFLTLRSLRPDAFLRILTKSDSEEAAGVLERTGLGAEDFWVGAVPPAEVPALLGRARLGISFRKPTFSQIASSPTKIPEYLAAGLPVVSNAGVGDTDELLEREAVGVVVREFKDEDYLAAARRALALAAEEGISVRCQQVARAHFDLVQVGGVRYAEVYRKLEQ